MTDEEDSVEDDMDIDWFWAPPPLDTTTSLLAEEKDTRVLRPEALEFILPSHSLKVPL